MGNRPEDTPATTDWTARLVRAVQIAAGIACLLLYSQLARGVPNAQMLPKLRFEFYFFDLWPAVPLFLLGIAVLVTAWKKVGLVLTTGTGLALLACLLRLFKGYLGGNYGQWPKAYFTLLVVLQAVLLAVSAAGFWLLRNEHRSGRLLAACFAVPVIVLASSVAFGPFLAKGPQRDLDAVSTTAVESVRTLNAALHAYASSHPRTGYPTSLDELGPRKAGLVDDLLATGLKRGYSFNYRPYATETGGRITTYNLNARPLEYWGSGLYSYFTDPTGVIHWTKKDREANERDPAISSLRPER